MTRLAVCLLGHVVMCWTALQAMASSPPISVSIQATWPEPPLLIQIIESAELEHPHIFFPLITAVSLHWQTLNSDINTHQALYEETLKVIRTNGYLGDSGEIESLEMSIALKEASPKIEAFRKWYQTLELNRTQSNQPTNVTSQSVQCMSWADVYGTRFCDAARLHEYLSQEDDFASSPRNLKNSVRPRILPFDHIFPSDHLLKGASAPVIILYASDDPRSFGPFHDVLYQASQHSPMRAVYVFRWQVSSRQSSATARGPGYLTGWATRLDVKKSDYLTVDDRPVEANAKDSSDSSSKHKSNRKEEHSPNTTPGLRSFKAEEISEVGLKTTKHIMGSTNPLHALRVLCEDFPRRVGDILVDIDAPPEKETLETFSSSIVKPGQSGIWMNGLDISSLLPSPNVNMFKLIQKMRSERQWISSLVTLGLTPREARTLVSDEHLNSALAGDGSQQSNDVEIDPSILGERFDASDRPEQGGTILWLNDLEKDERYTSWPSSLRDFLRPTYPGQLHAVARNAITVILALNLTHTSNLRILAEMVETFITRGIPIRWGLIPLDESIQSSPPIGEEGSALYVLWNLFKSHGPSLTLRFIKQLTQSLTKDLVDGKEIKQKLEAYLTAPDTHHVIEIHRNRKDTRHSLEGEFSDWLKKARSYARRLTLCSGTRTAPGCMFINGKFFPVDNNFRLNLQQTAMLHLQFLQHQIYYGLIEGDEDVSQYLYDLPHVYPARNEFVFPSPDRPLRITNLVDIFKSIKLGSCGVLFESNGLLGSKIVDLLDDSNTTASTAIWVVGDLDSMSGAGSVMASLELLTSSPARAGALQVGFLHTGQRGTHTDGDQLSDFLADLISSKDLSDIKMTSLTMQLAKYELKPSTPFPEAFSFRRISPNGGECNVDRNDVWGGAQSFLRELDLPIDSVAILVNGRVLHVPHSQPLETRDLLMLIEYESQKRTIPIQDALLRLLRSEAFFANRSKVPLIASAIASMLVGSEDEVSEGDSGKGRINPHILPHSNSSSVSYGNEDTAILGFRVILNPASEIAQSWAPLLENLSVRTDVAITVLFNPLPQVDELPIKRFLRTAIYNRIQFDHEGSMIAPAVEFRHMPSDVLLTLSIEAPPAWLALPLESVHDLDNIMLSKLGPTQQEHGVTAVFQLENIIIAGHAREIPGETAPRGLQLVLTDALTLASVDTIIMANLGYFQFKATAGLFVLTIRSGRSSELYKLESIDTRTDEYQQNDEKNQNNDDSYQFALTTFDGVVLFPRFRKRPGKEDQELIQPVGASQDSATSSIGAAELRKFVGQVRNMATGILRGKIDDTLRFTKRHNVINVFTVASGLLYERMAYLMCVSVMRHTKSHVKFWFISNFLSPSFKRFIPHLAREYNFDYQLVTYRWPPWLRAQKEKQRVIWGYKILFLDVLFPLELDRVIFVDSDQIVRADLQALVDLDMRGAPYAYAPMCNDRDETKGFRFWDTGYWKESLQGRPYHISALYVVDLRVFRAIAAGDQLRQHYQALSADEGSLANLDQDLPNNMQTVLPIYTLDQSWLWCETWCSDEGLKTAKTIDLCNNPLTHEPKLTRARRLIPEWDVYDQEVAELAHRIKDNATVNNMSSEQSRTRPDTSDAHSKDEL